MINFPYSYDAINGYNSIISPSTVHVKNTGLARFFKRFLLQEAESVFDWKAPEEWDNNYFLTVLYCMGYFAVIDTPQYGIIPQHAGIGGFTVQYQPYYITIGNPLLPGISRLNIGKDCEVVRLSPDWCGIYDLVDYYGDLMALCAETAGVNVLNSKFSFIFSADNKASAESYKKLYDAVASGEPMAVADKDLFDDDGNLRVNLFVQDVGRSFIADKLLDCLRTIRTMFLTDIGIPNANTDKKERLITDEVNANNFETRAKASLWLDELKKSIERTRKFYGKSKRWLDVDWREDLKQKEGDMNGDAGNPDAVQIR